MMHDRDLHNDKPWIDLGVMALPRKSVKNAMASLLRHWTDRSQFNVRLICHVDAFPFPDYPGRALWRETMSDTLEASREFEDVTLLGSTCNQGYGGSFYRVLSEVEHPFFYQDDDQYWQKEFVLSEIIQKELDYYSFVGGRIAGSAPSVWSIRLVRHVVDNFPDGPKCEIVERQIMKIPMDDFSCSEWVPRTTTRRKHNSTLPVVNLGTRMNRRLKIPLPHRTGPNRSIFNRTTGVRERKRG